MTDVVVVSVVDRRGSVTDDVDGVDEFNVVVTGWLSSPLETIV